MAELMSVRRLVVENRWKQNCECRCSRHCDYICNLLRMFKDHTQVLKIITIQNTY